MAREGLLHWRRRAQGVGFLLVVALLVAFTVAIYNKALPWQASDTVYLTAQRIGNELIVPADVKYDGVLVGRVSAVNSNGQDATLTLQMDKSAIGSIPANVEARILPKTLFGDKFVQLVQPQQPSSQTLQAGATIPEDHSQVALELQTVFTHLVPLLRALNPAQLSITLHNVAATLQGRGNELGQSLVLTDQFFQRFNRDLPNLNHDISALATLANNYADASPDLLAFLRNFSQTAQTFVDKQRSYATFLANSQGLAAEATKVFGQNTRRLIDLNRVSRPVTQLYSDNSIVLECMANGLSLYDRFRLEGVFGTASASGSGRVQNPGPSGGVPGLHITLIPVGDRGSYSRPPTRAEYTNLPRFHGYRKLCRGLPYGNHDLEPHFDRVPTYRGGPSGNYAAGGFSPSTGSSSSGKGGTSGRAANSAATTPGTRGAGSSNELNAIGRLLGAADGSTAHIGLDDLLLGPMLRGMAVVPG
jgi:phospholipid/cholesterol/gamma-HCH transport system substrate-binding protein